MITQEGMSRIYDRMDAVMDPEYRKLVYVEGDPYVGVYKVKLGDTIICSFACEPIHNDTTEEGTRELDRKIKQGQARIPDVLQEAREVDERQNRQGSQAEDEVQTDPTAADEAHADGDVRPQGEEAGHTTRPQDLQPTGWCRYLHEEVAVIKKWWRKRKIRREGKRLRSRKGQTVVARIQVETRPGPQPYSETILGRPENIRVHRDAKVNHQGIHFHTLAVVAKQGNSTVVIDVDDPLELMHELCQGFFWMHERDRATAETPANEHKTRGGS